MAVSPRLLADSLAGLLAREGVEVVPITTMTGEHFDLAVVTPGEPPVSAQLIVELVDGPAGTAAATARGPSGGPLVRLHGLAAIIDFVRDLATHALEIPDGQR